MMNYMTVQFQINRSAEKTTHLDNHGNKKNAIKMTGIIKTGLGDADKPVTFYQLGDNLDKLQMYLYEGREITVKIAYIKENKKSYTTIGWVKDLGEIGRQMYIKRRYK